MFTFSDYFTFLNLIRKRLQSEGDYINFQRFQMKKLLEDFEKRDIIISGLRILDCGCGLGGYGIELEERGGNVTFIDFRDSIHQDFKNAKKFVTGNAMEMPFKEGSFDFVLCSSLIEHVTEPEKLIGEIERVLSVGGRCYLSFPPFYSPFGGHQFKPFHLFGEKTALKLAKLFYKKDIKSYSSSFVSWGLYSITVKDVKRYISKSSLLVDDITTKFLPVNFARIPLINEFLTWHVEFWLRKRSLGKGVLPKNI